MLPPPAAAPRHPAHACRARGGRGPRWSETVAAAAQDVPGAASSRLRSTTCTASWSASRGEAAPTRGKDTRSCDHCTPRRRLRPTRRRTRRALTFKDTTRHLRRALGRRRELGGRAAPLGLRARRTRVAIYLDKRIETVASIFGTSARRRRLRAGQPGAEAQAGRATSCATATCACSSPRPSGWRCSGPSSTARQALEHVVLVDAQTPDPVARRAARDAVLWVELSWRAGAPIRADRASTSTWRRSSTPRAAPASRRASCSRTATCVAGARASASYLGNRPATT